MTGALHDSFTISENGWIGLILSSTAIVLLIAVYCLAHGITIVFMYLFYFPITLLTYHYRWKGFLESVLVSFTYGSLVWIFYGGNTGIVLDALIRIIVFIGIAATLAYLADQLFQRTKYVEQVADIRESSLMNANVVLVLLDDRGRILLWNNGAERISGYSAAEVTGSNDIWKLIYPDSEHRGIITRKIKEILAKDNFFENFETAIRTKNGETRIISWNTRNLPVTAELESRAIAVGVDVTDRKRIESALKDSEERFKGLFDTVTSGIAIYEVRNDGTSGKDYVVKDFNKIALEIEGKRKGEVVGKSFFDLRPAIDEYGLISVFHRVWKTGEPEYFPEKIYVDENYSNWYENRVFRLKSDEIVAVYNDITTRMQAEEDLRNSRQILSTVLDNIPARVFWKDRNLNYLGCNLPFAQDAGFHEPEDLIGKDDYQMGWHEQAELYRADDRYVMNSGKPKKLIEEPQTTPDGRTIWLLTSKVPLRNASGSTNGVLGTYVDITDRKMMENALRESETRFRTMANWTYDWEYWTDRNRAIVYVSPSCYRITGYTPDEFIAEKELIDRIVHPDDLARWTEHLLVHLHSDWETAPAEIEFRIISKNGMIHWIGHNCRGIYEDDGTWAGRRISNRDITKAKQAEEVMQVLVKELEQKNTELNQFTYTVSHDLKSPLITISGFLGLLKEDIQKNDQEKAEIDMDRISSAAEKMEGLISTLLELSRSGKVVDTPVVIPFAQLAREAADLLDASLKNRGVALIIDDDLPEVSGDHQRLLQALTNLLENAIKFMGDQKEPVVEVGVRQVTKGPVLFVRDNGMGIRKEDQLKIFGIFERLRPDIPGSGIGLPTVRRIIEAHGGNIWVESEGPGKGSTFLFTLRAGILD